MSAIVTHVGGSRYLVVCREHHLNRTVATADHAENLRRLHDRYDHAPAPEPDGIRDLDLTAAAAALIEETRTPGQGSALEGAAAVWAALTGLPDDEALDLAREITGSGITLTAHTAPF